MIFKSTIKVAIFIILFFSFICLPQEHTSPSKPYVIEISIESSSIDEQLTSYWFNRKEYIRRGDFRLAESEREKIMNTLKERHIKSLPPLSATFIAEGIDFLEKGNISHALVSFQSAIQIDPYSPAAYFYLARANLKQSKRNLITYLSLLFKGLIAPFKNYKFFYISWAQLIKIIFMALFFSIVIFITIKLIKYQALIRHDFSEVLTPKIGPVWGNILPWCIILFPLLIMMGIIWVLIYWLIIIWVYYSTKEKALALLFLLFLFLAYPITIFNRALFNSAKSPTIAATLTSMANVYDSETVNTLDSLIAENPYDVDAQFLLASQLKKYGKLEETFDQYNKILRIDHKFHLAYNNIANIYFISNEYRLAIENYKKAISQQPEEALYYYNLSLAYSEILQFENARDAIQKAEERDKALVHKLRTEHESKVVDATLSRKILKGKLWLDFKKLLFAAIDKPSLSKLPLLLAIFLNPLSIISLAVFIILLFLNLRWKEKRLAQFCDRCGSAFCFRCRIAFSPSKTCSQCEHIFVKQDGLLPEIKRAKLSQIKIYQLKRNLQKWIFSILLPGAWQQLEQRSFGGFLLNFLWFFGIIFIISYNHLYNYQLPIETGKLAFPQIIALAGLAIILLISLVKLKRSTL